MSLLAWGGWSLGPRPHEPLAENGRGGPAEYAVRQSPADVGQLDLSREPAADGALMRLPDTFYSTGEMGPVFGRDQGTELLVIGKGQTFYEAMAARGAAHSDIMTIVKNTREFRNLRAVKSGQKFRVRIAPDGGLQSLGYDLDEESHITWVRDGDSYLREDGTYPVERVLKGISGTIENSLYASLQKIDAPLSLAPKMSDILGWDLDFKRDLRVGDTFRVLYEEVWKDGKLVRTDGIQALEIVNKGKVRRAFLFSEGDLPRYYDGEGNSMQKQLLRAPLNYSRISDGFTQRRFHPVLKRWMPHLGVDYAAPLGTPVRAGGDGVVVAATSKQGNGRYIQIRHTNSEYETFYLHLSKFAKGITSGRKVTQGEVIGYVGATGYATGPHLDYRIKRRGQFINPRQLKSPAAAPVSADQRARYAALSGQLTTALAEIPLDQSIALAPIMMLDPPAWDPRGFAQASLPVAVRALN